MLNKTLT